MLPHGVYDSKSLNLENNNKDKCNNLMPRIWCIYDSFYNKSSTARKQQRWCPHCVRNVHADDSGEGPAGLR
jgi:hypothetical protein